MLIARLRFALLLTTLNTCRFAACRRGTAGLDSHGCANQRWSVARSWKWWDSMRMVAAGLLLVLIAAPSAFGVNVRDHRNPSTRGSAFELQATAVFELPIHLNANERVIFETRNLSSGADPILHLLSPQASDAGSAFEVARDDDSLGNLAARIRYTPTATGTYTIVLRAAWNGRGGTTDLYQNDQLIWPDLPFGGGFKRLEKLRKKETLTTVALPHSPFEHFLYLIDDDGKMLERHRSDATLGVHRSLPASWGVRNVMVGVHWLFEAPGPVRVVRNDGALPTHDPDRDGLGRELESNIGTCSRSEDVVGNWECSRSTDLRDTDGDAISDALELLGFTAKKPYQFLPRWGADPRHKDIFIEMDFMMRREGDPDDTMTPEVVREVAAIYADPEPNLIYRLAHAQVLGNPDLEPGIRLHIDTGQNPSLGAPDGDRTLYGDWGGHNRVPPDCSGGECKGLSASDAWLDHMHANRRGLFHYALTYGSGGGSTPVHKVYSSFNHRSSGNAAHEFGHSLGLGHNGPHDGEPIDANCKPNYPSLMSYAYLHRDYRQFSDGYGRPLLNNTKVKERGAVGNPASTTGRRYLENLRDVFDYDVDLKAGHVDWNRDGIFSSGSVPAYTNNNGEGCEFTKYNAVALNFVSNRSPALARLGNMTMAFHLTPEGKLQFHYTLDALACPEPAVRGCGPEFNPFNPRFIDEPWNHGGLQAFDAHRIAEEGTKKILVVYMDSQSRLWEVKFTSLGFKWSRPVRIVTSTTPRDELSLAGNEKTVYLAFKGGSENRVTLKQRTEGGVWGDDEVARDTANALLRRLGSGSSPALLHVAIPTGGVLYGAFPQQDPDADRNGKLRLYSFVSATRRWEESPWLSGSQGTQGKPAMAWKSLPAGSALPGRLHLFWMRRNAAGETIVKEQSLIAKNENGVLEIRMGLTSDHQNEWFYAFGLDLLYEEGVDTNLRALVARKKRDGDENLVPARLEVRPKADGIVDYGLRNWNDWDVLRVGSCRVLSASARFRDESIVDKITSPDPIKCPDWIW
jgi:hypothetical protein